MNKLERIIITVAFVGGMVVTVGYFIYLGYTFFGGLI